MSGSEQYTKRLIDARLRRLFAELPAILLTGPRATGKTTTAARLREGRSWSVSTGQPMPRRSRQTLTRRCARMREPVLLDEWQAVPGVLGAVKRAVDADPRPGSFLLTGSIRAELKGETWPGTGRLVRLRMFGLTERELAGIARKPSSTSSRGTILMPSGSPPTTRIFSATSSGRSVAVIRSLPSVCPPKQEQRGWPGTSSS